MHRLDYVDSKHARQIFIGAFVQGMSGSWFGLYGGKTRPDMYVCRDQDM